MLMQVSQGFRAGKASGSGRALSTAAMQLGLGCEEALLRRVLPARTAGLGRILRPTCEQRPLPKAPAQPAPSRTLLAEEPASRTLAGPRKQYTRCSLDGSMHASSVSREKSKAALEEILALLRSEPSLAGRLAASVDTRIAEEWALARAKAEEAAAREQAAPLTQPTGRQLWRLHVRTAVPFVGFGFFDNVIMLSVGGTIESTIGVACGAAAAARGISSLAAAGLGQMVSDASGITLQGLIERFADRLGLPRPGLTVEQQQLPRVKSFMLASRILGIMLGCSLGMAPLLVLPAKE